MEVRRWGSRGRDILLLHGGPGALDSTTSLARAVSDRYVVHEPVQRARTVDGHIRDLAPVVEALSDPVLVGWSWGAMLALAYAAEHPVASLLLIGCGTFDERARARLRATRAERLDGEEPRTCEEWARAVRQTDDYDLRDDAPGPGRLDTEAGEATWEDMLRRQREGRYPAAFAAIRAPALLVHGDFDPHPGALVAAGLRPCLPQLEYAEIPRCGHSPWLERQGSAPFFKLFHAWVDTGRILP